MDTMNLWLDIARESMLRNLRHVDLLMVNDEEARQLSGEYSLVKAAKVIMAMGPDFLIIKKGEHGALLFHGQEVFFAPALPLEEVFDPTGAGDTFAGGCMGTLDRAISKNGVVDDAAWRRAMLAGTVMASFVVEAFSFDRMQTLTNEEILARAKELQAMTTVEGSVDLR
jgi:sugar/nucleoside kinase (ribokinase family)